MSRREFVDACILEVEVTTNTPCGGDGGHGGRTVVRFIDAGGTDMSESHIKHDGFDAEEVALVLRGDAEARVLAKALIWAGQKLLHQIEDNGAERFAVTHVMPE